jgi:hypothetical protein
MRKGKDPDPYLCLTDPDTDPGGLKIYGSGTLVSKNRWNLESNGSGEG